MRPGANVIKTFYRGNLPPFHVRPGANVIKLFTAVIYPHSKVIPSFRVIKLYYLGNYCGMTVNDLSISTLEKVGLELMQ